MNVLLIHPPTDSSYSGRENKSLMSVPVGLELIAKAADRPGRNIRVVDGNKSSLDEIMRMIDAGDADVVGVSDIYSNHKNSLAILEAAKKRGAVTVIGGPNANHLAERILYNNWFVDYAIRGDGEEAFNNIVSGKPLENISNLSYREKGSVLSNPTKEAGMNTLFNLEHIDHSAYSRSVHMPLSSIRGCIKASLYERCSFCSIDHKLKLMAPELVWEQVRILKEDYGFDYFFETGDSFIVSDYPERLLESRPESLKGVRFKVYATPESIDDAVAETLSSLNVSCIFLGSEAANKDLLARIGKRHSKYDVLRVIDMIRQRDVHLLIPFMFGLPGETISSMEENYAFAQKVLEKHSSTSFLVSKAIPLIGSKLFKDLAKNGRVRSEYRGDLEKDDLIDYGQLWELQTELFTSVKADDIELYCRKTNELLGEGQAGYGI